MIKVNPNTRKALKDLSQKFNVNLCFSCGTCTALCPVGLKILPREIFRYTLLGEVEKIVEAQEAIYACLLCRLCEANCPEGVNISENLRLLRKFLVKHLMSVNL